MPADAQGGNRYYVVANTGGSPPSCQTARNNPAAPFAHIHEALSCADLDGTTQASPDTIEIAAGNYPGSLSIRANVNLVGAGAGTTSITGGTSVINNNSAIHYALGVAGLTISGGVSGPPGGGGISNAGTLTLTNSIVSDNHGPQGGGGIFNAGTANLTNSTVSGNESFGNGGGIYNTGALTLTASSVSDNHVNESGGGIFNSGTVNLTNSTVSGNESLGSGGGIYGSGGRVTLTGSTVSNNSASFFESATIGGGIFNGRGSSLTLTASTVSNNVGTFEGGGIYNEDTANLTNSTVSGNSTGRRGGGIFNTFTLRLTHSTVSNNRQTQSGGLGGGGIYTFDNGIAAAVLSDTIVAGNSATDRGPDCVGALFERTGTGHNLLGNDSNCTGLTNGVNGDQVGSGAAPINPVLGPLSNNGGPTQTMALGRTSPAIAAASKTGCLGTLGNQDQRGNPRRADQRNTCDVGAYDTAGVLATITTGGTSPTGVAVSPNGTRAYATNAGSNTVSVIDTTTNTVIHTTSVGASPEGVAVAPDGSQVYVSNFKAGTVSIINASNNTVVKTVTVGNHPTGIVQLESVVYVANAGSGTVSEIDTLHNDAVSSPGAFASLGGEPTGLAADAPSNTLFVTNASANTLTTYFMGDPSNPVVAGEVSLPSGSGPTDVAVSSAGAFVALPGTNQVAVVNPDFTVRGYAAVPGQPLGVAVHAGPAGGVIATSSSLSTTSMVNPGTPPTVVSTTTVGSAPDGVASSPDGWSAYVANTSSGAVTVLATNPNSNLI